MSQDQHFQTVQQWAEESDEAERIEAANQALQDEMFRANMETKFPQLWALWPGRTE